MRSRCTASTAGVRETKGDEAYTCRPYRFPALDRAVAPSGLPAAGPLLNGDIRSFILEVCPSGVVGWGGPPEGPLATPCCSSLSQELAGM